MTKRRTTADLARWLAPLRASSCCNAIHRSAASILSSNDARIKNNTHAAKAAHTWRRRARNIFLGRAGDLWQKGAFALCTLHFASGSREVRREQHGGGGPASRGVDLSVQQIPKRLTRGGSPWMRSASTSKGSESWTCPRSLVDLHPPTGDPCRALTPP
ncbi:hypothetical protein L207DRAFT_24616 [Hyaloscypha variabilis F]|uniref:THAP-type domain-containing protein n=1 Tax=Hyaloscypha variabilis (strain UAMH 11265 / GT02V1 / F) TaxID=1149755 RepID=A0A2J6RMB9_HYAVF|nr:hypothetical protein L207DRAFT_24616 [Hyaloscypha variabilis F]